MKISKTHKRFSERLEQPDALTNPEKYLGPNYQDVLNFWIYLDTLSDPEKKEMEDCYFTLDYNVRYSAKNAARGAADDVVGEDFRIAAWRAAYDVSERWVFGYATSELIGSHKLLEQDKTPLTLQYCTKS